MQGRRRRGLTTVHSGIRVGLCEYVGLRQTIRQLLILVTSCVIEAVGEAITDTNLVRRTQ